MVKVLLTDGMVDRNPSHCGKPGRELLLGEAQLPKCLLARVDQQFLGVGRRNPLIIRQAPLKTLSVKRV